MLAAALAAGFASRVPSPPRAARLILPPRVGSGFVRVETHVAHRRRALRSRRRVGRGVLHGELMRAAGPGRLRLLLDGWLGLGLRLDRRLVQEGSAISSFAVSLLLMGAMHLSTNDRRSASIILSSASGLTPSVTRLKICAGLRHSLYGHSCVTSSMMHIPNE